MTDEQIKQSSEAYCDEYFSPLDVDGGQYAEEDFIAGYHSRNEEIEQLKKAIYSAQKAMAELAEIARNPWISVEKRLPDEHSRVLIMFCNGTVTYNDYIGVEDINYMKAHSKTITHWMPIPELN